jgi:hypothetical protein
MSQSTAVSRSLWIFGGAVALSVAGACSSDPGPAVATTPGTDAATSTSTSEAGAGAETGAPSSDGGGCVAPAQVTAAAHISLTVSWDGTTFLSGGTGTADVWLLATYSLKDSLLNGSAKTCGITIPPVTSTVIAGSKKVELLFADNWDKPSMPSFTIKGSQMGWNVGDTLHLDPTTGSFGLAAASQYANPKTPWPATGGSFPQFTAGDLVDSDGVDGPGITASASTAPGFSLLPTSADFITSPTADRVSVVARNIVALTGKATACGEFAGSATVTLFENHIVGCHDTKGDNCATSTSGTSAGPGFLDANRTFYKPGDATFVAKQLPEGSTCADVRAALP